MTKVCCLYAALLGLIAPVALGQDFVSARSEPSPSAVSAAAPAPKLQDRNPRYRLRAGDTFDIDFALSPEFNQTVTVQPDGYGSLKGVGTVPVEGQTIPQLTETIKTAYTHVLENPLVVIVLKDFDKPYFIATGQVAKPGKYELRTDLTMTEALAVAGGVTDKAKMSKVVLYRKTADGNFEGKEFDMKKLLASRNLSEDPRIAPGDLIYVPQNKFSHVRPFLPTSNLGAFYDPMQY